MSRADWSRWRPRFSLSGIPRNFESLSILGGLILPLLLKKMIKGHPHPVGRFSTIILSVYSGYSSQNTSLSHRGPWLRCYADGVSSSLWQTRSQSTNLLQLKCSNASIIIESLTSSIHNRSLATGGSDSLLDTSATLDSFLLSRPVLAPDPLTHHFQPGGGLLCWPKTKHLTWGMGRSLWWFYKIWIWSCVF